MSVQPQPRLGWLVLTLVLAGLCLALAGALAGAVSGGVSGGDVSGGDASGGHVSGGHVSGGTSAAGAALALQRTILTTPFAGSKVSMQDNEGSAWVPRDNSLWLADDNGRRLYEVNARTGRLKRTIGERALAATRRFGGGARAGTRRVRDIEGLAYDAARDRLYAFSGKCCESSVRPTVFRLTRQSGRLRLTSYQSLSRRSDNTAAAWDPRTERIYVGHGDTIRAYSYGNNSYGKRIRVPKLDDILGMDFTADGSDLYVTRYGRRLSRVDWPGKELVPGWTFDLGPFRIRDARAVEMIRGRLLISDGYDDRPKAAPMRYAVFALDIVH